MKIVINLKIVFYCFCIFILAAAKNMLKVKNDKTSSLKKETKEIEKHDIKKPESKSIQEKQIKVENKHHKNDILSSKETSNYFRLMNIY